MRRFYLAFRMLTIAGAVFYLLASLSCELFLPALCYDQGPVPPEGDRMRKLALSFILAGFMVIPFRWTLVGLAFWLRMSFFLAISIWLFYVSARGVFGFVAGRKHWLILPVTGFILVFAIALPASLALARSLKKLPAA